MKLFPITIRLSDMKNVQKRPLLKVLDEPMAFEADVSYNNKLFTDISSNVFRKLFEFLEVENIRTNIIISGDILENMNIQDTDTLQILQRLVDSKQVIIIADSFYSESCASMYYQMWWRESVIKSINSIKNILKLACKCIYIPQLFRGLELELLVEEIGVVEFLIPSEGKLIKNYRHFSQKLSDFRKYDGHSLSWIKEKSDSLCTFHFIPQKHFININDLLIGYKSNDIVKLITMGIGHIAFKESSYSIKSTRSSTYMARIPEVYSLAHFTQIQRAIMRLWAYASKITLSELHSHDTEFLRKIHYFVGRMQNSDYLLYCLKDIYKREGLNFSSPYEFFANTQASIENVRILLKNKL